MDPFTLMSLAGIGMNAAGALAGPKSLSGSLIKSLPLSKAAGKLYKQFAMGAKSNWSRAISGDVRDIAHVDFQNVMQKETDRNLAAVSGLGSLAGSTWNREGKARGYAAPGSVMVKATSKNSAERMAGLASPTGEINRHRREDLYKAAEHLGTLWNLDAAKVGYGYQAGIQGRVMDRMASAEQGAAWGSLASSIGGFALNSAYMGKLNSLQQGPNVPMSFKSSLGQSWVNQVPSLD